MEKRTRGFVVTIFPQIETEDIPWDPWTIDWIHVKPAIQAFTCQLEQTPSTNKIHWQCALEFKHPQSFQQIKRCLEGLGAGKPHIEIRKGTALQAHDYCRKDESCADEATRFSFGQLSPVQPTKDEIFRAAINAEDFTAACAYIKEHAPRDYVMHKSAIDNNLKAMFEEMVSPIKEEHEFVIPLKSKSLLEKYSVFLYGPSGTGKTTYAMAHFQQPLLCRHIDDLKSIHTKHDGVIFDDMSFKHYPRTTCIHLLDLDYTSSIHVRYGTAKLRAGLPRIFTSNETFGDVFNCQGVSGESLPDALLRRTKRYRVCGYLGKQKLHLRRLQQDAWPTNKCNTRCKYPLN